jgi:hypothetical protein
MLHPIPSAALRWRSAIYSLPLLVTLALAACSDSTGPDGVQKQQKDAELILRASLAGTTVSSLAVTVTGEGIPLALIFNLTVDDQGLAFGTIKVPPGLARTIRVEAFDETGQVTHEGLTIIDVQAGNNPPVVIVLVPKPGQIPITVTMAEFFIQVSPGSAHLLAVDDQVTLTAEVFTFDLGFPINATVEWASSNPAVATVDNQGLVTAHANGEATIAATYQGVAGHAQIVVGVSNSPFIGNYSGTGASTPFGENPEILDALFGGPICSEACSANLFVSSPSSTSLFYNLVIGGIGLVAFSAPDSQNPVFYGSPPFIFYPDGITEYQCQISAFISMSTDTAQGSMDVFCFPSDPESQDGPSGVTVTFVMPKV